MMNLSESKKSDVALLIVRLAAGLIFVMHGYGKLWGGNPGMEGFTGFVASIGFPMPAFFAYCAALSEVVGGLLVMLGAWTRIAAIFPGIVIAVAFFAVKGGNLPKGDLEFLLLAVMVALALGGGGNMTVMKWLKKGGSPAGEVKA